MSCGYVRYSGCSPALQGVVLAYCQLSASRQDETLCANIRIKAVPAACFQRGVDTRKLPLPQSSVSC